MSDLETLRSAVSQLMSEARLVAIAARDLRLKRANSEQEIEDYLNGVLHFLDATDRELSDAEERYG